MRRGKPDEQIGALAADIKADLIVVGNFGLHNPRSKYKNLPNGVLNAAVCPVMVHAARSCSGRAVLLRVVAMLTSICR